jgi:hypothetical protein
MYIFFGNFRMYIFHMIRCVFTSAIAEASNTNGPFTLSANLINEFKASKFKLGFELNQNLTYCR